MYIGNNEVQKIPGVVVTPLKTFDDDKGSVLHGIKASCSEFVGFGEAYFSTVNQGYTKGWKKHLRMTMNLIVPIGAIRFFLIDARGDVDLGRKIFDVTLSKVHYCRLTVPPGIWVAFEGVGSEKNLLLNIANLEHCYDEFETKSLSEFPVDLDLYR